MATRGLMRRDPFLQDLLEFRRSFDDVFQRFFTSPLGEWGREAEFAWMPPAEIFVEQNKVHACVALPGVKPEDVNVEIHQNQLVIRGERKQEREVKEEQYLQREMSYGRFERRLPLPEGIDADKIEATYRNGILDVAVPLAEKALPKRIEIKAEPGKKLAA